MPLEIACIVEGHGEVQAVPELIRRIARDLGKYPKVHRPIRASRDGLIIDKLGEYVDTAQGLGDDVGTLLLFDTDDNPACSLGPGRLALVRKFAPHRRSAAVLAVREFENWFIAGIAGLWGKRGIPVGLQPPANVESIRDAKGWLSRNMKPGSPYKETSDQAAFAARFDMQEARRLAPSFDKCWREVESLLSAA